MLVKDLLLQNELNYKYATNVKRFLDTLSIDDKKIDVLLTPDETIYVTKDKYTLDELLSANVPNEVFQMHEMKTIVNSLHNEVLSKLRDIKEEELSIEKVKTQVKSLIATITKLEESKRKSDEELVNLKKLVEEKDDGISNLKGKVRRLEVCLESKEQESKEREKRNNIYSSKVDYMMGDVLFDIVNRM